MKTPQSSKDVAKQFGDVRECILYPAKFAAYIKKLEASNDKKAALMHFMAFRRCVLSPSGVAASIQKMKPGRKRETFAKRFVALRDDLLAPAKMDAFTWEIAEVENRKALEEKFSYLKTHLSPTKKTLKKLSDQEIEEKEVIDQLNPTTKWNALIDRLRGVILIIGAGEEYSPAKLYSKDVRVIVTAIQRGLEELAKLDKDACRVIWSHWPDSPKVNYSGQLIAHKALIADCAAFLKIPTPKDFKGKQGQRIVELLDDIRKNFLTIELSSARTDPFLLMVRDVGELCFPGQVLDETARNWIRIYKKRPHNH